jgi:hypothetical protein
MPATKIMLIRHAEKPDDKDGGVDQKGNADNHDLIVRGWQRAGALVQFFANPPDPNSHQAAGDDFRHRTRHRKRKQAPAAHRDAAQAMARHCHRQHHCRRFRTRSGGQSDCQQRRGADRLASRKNSGDRQSDPAKSERAAEVAGDRFDVVWIFSRAAASDPWIFTQAPQLLLSGDSPDVIASS